VGNPNVGKSVLFNALTGSYVTVSNYPGTSVEVSRGTAVITGQSWQVIDTPGMYAVHTITEEERVAREILLNEKPDVVLHVLDARNLERMLAMTIQLIEAGLPVVLVVNIMDEAERLGLSFDLPLLQQRLGIPVIAAATARKRGIEEIKTAIAEFGQSCGLPISYSRLLERDIAEVSRLLQGSYVLSRLALSLLLLQGDEEVSGLVAQGEGERYPALAEKVREIAFERRESFHLDLSMERKEIVNRLVRGVIAQPDKRRETWGSRLSTLAVQPLTGIPLLLVTLYFGLYKFVGDFGAGTLVDFLEGELFEKLFNPWITTLLTGWIPWWWLQELLVGEYGIITLGLRYAVGIILPIVTTFFNLLFDSGGCRLPAPSGVAGGSGLQVVRSVGPFGDSDGTRFRLQYHGHHGDPHPGDGTGAGDRHAAAGPGYSLLCPAGGDSGTFGPYPGWSAGLDRLYDPFVCAGGGAGRTADAG